MDNQQSEIHSNDESQLSSIGFQFNQVEKQQLPLSSSIFAQQKEILGFQQTTIQQLVLNKIEALAKTVSQVLAIEVFKKYTNKTKGWSVYQLQNEISEQRRCFNNLEIDCVQNGKQQEFKLAKDVFIQHLKILEDLLQNQEHKQQLQNILQPIPVQSAIIVQPDQKYMYALENFHYQCTINFHNSLQKDKTGKDLVEKIQIYSKELTRYLYFEFVEQEVKILNQLLNYVLIHKTQNTCFTLQYLNDVISQIRTSDEKEKIMSEIQLIIDVFKELSDYFQEIKNCITDQYRHFDSGKTINEFQFEIIMLIYDSMMHDKKSLNFKVSKSTKGIMQFLKWIYKIGSFESMQKQIKDLKKYFISNASQELSLELHQISNLFISTKLRFLMSIIVQMNVLQDSDINLDYFHFTIIFFQDQEIIQQCLEFNDDEFNNIIHEPSSNEQSMNIHTALNSFTNVCTQTAICETEINKKQSIDHLEELKIKVKESFQSISKEICSINTINQLSDLLNKIFWFQKLNPKIFDVLYKFFLDIQNLQNQLKKQKQEIQNNDDIPNLYQLLIAFQLQDQKDVQFKKKFQEIEQLIQDDKQVDFHDLIEVIEQFDPKQQQLFISNVKQYYVKDFKVHLQNLVEFGSKSFQEAAEYLFQQIDP